MADICKVIMVLVLNVLLKKAVNAVPDQTGESKTVSDTSHEKSTAEFHRSSFENVRPPVKSEGGVNFVTQRSLGNAGKSVDRNFDSENSVTTQWMPFSTTSYETSSWTSFTTPPDEINLNCILKITAVKTTITYCTNAWGLMFRSIPIETTTPTSINVPDEHIEEVSNGKQDKHKLPRSGISYMINPELALETICPESVQCPVAQSHSEIPSNPCCIQCDCSDACVDSGTCCLNKDVTDINIQHVNSKTTETCVKTYLGEMSPNVVLQSTLTFMLIHSCPEEDRDIMDSTTKDKCIHPDEKSLRESVPFFSNKTNKSYRNIYCARCNNDAGFGKYWDGYFSCTSTYCFNLVFKNSIESTGSSTSGLIDHIGEAVGVMIYWKPPSNDVKTCVAQDTIISTCKRKNNYRRFLDNFCSRYYAPLRGKYGTYRNWFCLLCNDDVWKCALDETDLFTSKISLDEFLNSPSSVVGGVKNVGARCGNGLQFDTSLNECVRKSCAITKVNVNGTCFPVMTHTSGISFDYRLNVVYPLTLVPSVDSVLDSVRSLSLLPNDNGNCVERVLEIDARRDQTVVRVQLVKSVKELRHVQTEFQTFKQRVIRINEKAVMDQTQFEVEIAVAPLAPVVEGYVSFSSFADVTSATKCGSPIAMSELQFCDTVLLYDFTLNFNGIVYVESASFMPGEYIAKFGSIENSTVGKDDTKSVSVCYDLYVSRMMKLKGDTEIADLNTVSNDATSCVLSDKWLCVLLQLIILFQ